jgi:hypothetical protein
VLCIISVSRYVYGNAAMTIKELFSPVIRHAELGLNMVMPYTLRGIHIHDMSSESFNLPLYMGSSIY